MAEKSQEEYDSLCAEKSSYENQKAARESQNSAINEKIKRLKVVKNTVADLKKDFKTNKKITKDTIEDQYTWIGSNYDKFKSIGSDLIRSNENYYKDTLDHVHDSINNEITRLENIVHENNGFIGWCIAKINSLANAIENFFN